MRKFFGVLFKDWPRYHQALNDGGYGYLTLCNRTERLEPAPNGRGFRCDWKWTTDLHAPKCLPNLGLKLLSRALADHPIRRLSQPKRTSSQPDISFIIGHRGMDRLPHLLATLESISAQEGVNVECIVVEQDRQAQLLGHLPSWVRYVFTPLQHIDHGYCRSWAFNVGVRLSQSPVLILHDNDMLVPSDYAFRICHHVQEGYQVVNIKRYIFYLCETHSWNVIIGTTELTACAPDTILQNSEAGGSIAITNTGYQQIGGMDEGFVGWGGEDNEFWERAQTLRVWPYGYLPLVHLWHSNQPGKFKPDNPTLLRYRQLSEIPVNERIVTLRNLRQGHIAGPNTGI